MQTLFVLLIIFIKSSSRMIFSWHSLIFSSRENNIFISQLLAIIHFFEKFCKLRSKIETIEYICILLICRLCLPTLICLYRSVSIVTDKTFLLPYYSFFSLICRRQIIDNRLYEPMAFCYLPSLLLLYYLSAKGCSFFIKVMEKSGIVYVLFVEWQRLSLIVTTI